MRRYCLSRRVDAVEAEDRGWLILGDEVCIAEDVSFIPGDLKYRTRISTGSTIDFGSIIYNGTSIGEYSRISSNVRIEAGCRIGSHTFIGHGCVLRPGTHIGDNCTIGHLTVFEGDSEIKDGTLIHAQCHITKGVTIGERVFIAPLFVGANDPRMCHARRHCIDYKETPYVIGDGARIAVGVTLLPGVRIGHNAMVGAHALVTKDVPDNAIVRGVPAVVVGTVPEEERV